MFRALDQQTRRTVAIKRLVHPSETLKDPEARKKAEQEGVSWCTCKLQVAREAGHLIMHFARFHSLPCARLKYSSPCGIPTSFHYWTLQLHEREVEQAAGGSCCRGSLCARDMRMK